MKKKAPFIVIFSLLIVIGLLFLPTNEKATNIPSIELPEYSLEEEDEKIIEERTAKTKENLEQVKALATFLFTSMEFSEEELHELSLILTSYDMSVSHYHPNSIHIGLNEPVLFELNKHISEFVTQSDLPQIKKIKEKIDQNENYKKLEIITEHPFESYEKEELNKQTYILYHENSTALREINPKIIFEVPDDLKSSLSLDPEKKNYTISIYSTELDKTDEHFKRNEQFQQYEYQQRQLSMLQKAVRTVIHKYPNQDELYDYINSYTTISAFLTDELTSAQVLQNEMQTSSTLFITIALDNPYISLSSTEVFHQLWDNFSKISHISTTNDDVIILNDYSLKNNEPYLFQSYSLDLNNKEEPLEVSLTKELAEILELPSNKLTMHPSQTDYTPSEKEITISEGKKLLTTLINSLSTEQQKEVLAALINQEIAINDTNLEYLINGNNPTLYDYSYYISIKQHVSNYLLENESYYSIVEDQILSSEDLNTLISIKNIESLSSITIDGPATQEIYYFTKDAKHPFIEDELQLTLHQAYKSKEPKDYTLTNYLYLTGSSFNNELSADLIRYQKDNYEYKQIELLKNAVIKALEFIPEEEIVQLVEKTIVWEKINLIIGDTVVPLDQTQYSVTDFFRMEIQLTSPLFSVLPDDFGQKYLEKHKPTFLQSNVPETQSNYYSRFTYDNVFYIHNSFYLPINVDEMELTFEPALIENFNLPYETIKFMKE